LAVDGHEWSAIRPQPLSSLLSQLRSGEVAELVAVDMQTGAEAADRGREAMPTAGEE
jgi:hypothetical protein